MNRTRRPLGGALALVSLLMFGAGVGRASASVPVERYMAMAAERSAERNYLGAAFLYERILAEDSTRVDVMYNLGAVYREMGRVYSSYFEKARDVLRRVETQVGRDNPQMQEAWAQFYTAQWDLESAITIYEGLLAENPSDCRLWVKLGDSERLKAMVVEETEGIPAMEEQMAKAEETYRRTAELCPDRLEPYHGLAIIYNQRNEYGKTAEMYAQLMEKHPGQVDLIRGWTVAQFSGRNWAEAAKGLEQLLAKDPRPEERLQYISVLRKLDRMDEAAEQGRIYKETAPKLYGPPALLRVDALRSSLGVEDATQRYAALLDDLKFDDAMAVLREVRPRVEPLLQSEDPEDRDAGEKLLDWIDRRIAYAEEQKAKTAP